MKRTENWKKIACKVAAASMAMMLMMPGITSYAYLDDDPTIESSADSAGSSTSNAESTSSSQSSEEASSKDEDKAKTEESSDEAPSGSSAEGVPSAATEGSSEEKTNVSRGYIDTEKKGTLKVYYKFAGYGEMADVNVHVYKIASFTNMGEFTMLEPFDSLGLDIQDMTSISTHDQWKTITETLKTYVKNNDVKTYGDAVSGTDGFADLGSVDTGLYYGYSDPIEINGARYVYYDVIAPVPGPIMLDEYGNSEWDGTWQNASYDVITIPKRESSRLEGDPEEFEIFKQWVDNGAADKRPASISVKIFCDGELFDTVELSNENNWQYKWKYDKGHTFTLEEQVSADDYKVSISQNETSYIIVNTRNTDKVRQDNPPVDVTKKPKIPAGNVSFFTVGGETHDVTPPAGETPPVVESGSVLGAVRQLIGELPSVLGARRLPQTGQLWWPIPVLAILGVVLVLHGIRSEKRRKKQ